MLSIAQLDRQLIQLRADYQSPAESVLRIALIRSTQHIWEAVAQTNSYASTELPISTPYIEQAYLQFYYESGYPFYQWARNSIPQQKRITQDNPGGFLLSVQNFVRTSIGSRIESVTSHTRRLVRRLTDKFIRDGVSPVDAAIRMEQEWLALSTTRARTIAATEMVTLSGYSQTQGYYATGRELEKIWLTRGDSHVRPLQGGSFNHVSANKQRVPLDQDFIVSGQRLAYPGDPRGSRGNTIRCRCRSLALLLR